VGEPADFRVVTNNHQGMNGRINLSNDLPQKCRATGIDPRVGDESDFVLVLIQHPPCSGLRSTRRTDQHQLWTNILTGQPMSDTPGMLLTDRIEGSIAISITGRIRYGLRMPQEKESPAHRELSGIAITMDGSYSTGQLTAQTNFTPRFCILSRRSSASSPTH